MKHKRIGIAGAGRIAHAHKWATERLGLELVAVSSRRMESAERFAAGVPGCRPCRDVDEMLEVGIDALIICSPPVGRAATAVPALEKGVHCFIEKPMAGDLAEADTILAAAKKTGATVGIVCQREFLAPVRRVWAAIENGKLQAPVIGSASIIGYRDAAYYQMDKPIFWRGTIKGEHGALLMNQAPHHLNMLLSKLPPIARVSAVAANQTLQDCCECEDTAAAIAVCTTGAVVNMFFTNAAKPGRYAGVLLTDKRGQTVQVQTDREMFVAQGGAAGQTTAVASSMKFAPVLTEWSIDGEEHLLEKFVEEDRAEFLALGDDATKHYHMLALKDFIQAIDNGRQPRTDGATGRRVVELAVAIYRANAANAWLNLPLQADEDQPDDGLSKVLRFGGIPYRTPMTRNS